jgi:hypothetical protein
VRAVAACLCIDRQAIYKHITPFQPRSALDIVERVLPGERSGSPPLYMG